MPVWLRSRYEWVVTACAFMLLFVNVGCVSTSFSVYQPYIAALEGVGDAGAGAILTLRTTVSLVTLMVVDRLMSLLDVRVLGALACAFSGAGFVCYGAGPGMAGLAAGAVLAGLGNGLGSMVCVTVLLNRWFESGVGSAIGAATVGSGVAGAVVPVAATALIGRASLGSALVAEGLFALAVAALVLAFVRNRPRDVGRERGARPLAPKPRASRAHGLPAGVELPAHMRRGVYAAVFAFGAASVGGMAYLAILMTSEGFDPVFAAGALSAGAVFLIVSKVVTGWAFDAFGGLRTTAVLAGVLVAGMACLCLVPLRAPWLALAGAVLYSVGLSLGSVGISVWSIDLSGSERRAQSVKRLQVACMAGGVLFNLLPGLLKELTGTYVVSYAIMLVGVVAGTVLIARAYAWRERACQIQREACDG